MSKFCPECGKELQDNAKFCKECGAKIPQVDNTAENNAIQQPNQQYAPPAAENKHTVAVVLGYICAILIPLFGVIFAIYLLTRKDSDSAKFHGKIIFAVSAVIWVLSMIIMSSM